MKLLIALSAVSLAACATMEPPPAGMQAGQFVTFACADGKSFRARAAADGTSVRVRALHGAVELDRKGDGVYEGDGYRLETGGGNVNLMHSGKPEAQRCKPAA